MALTDTMTPFSELLVNAANGMSYGFATLVAHGFATRNCDRMNRTLTGMITLNLINGADQWSDSYSFEAFFVLMNTFEGIFVNEYTYIFIVCAGMTTTICYNMSVGILRFSGKSMVSQVFLTISLHQVFR